MEEWIWGYFEARINSTLIGWKWELVLKETLGWIQLSNDGPAGGSQVGAPGEAGGKGRRADCMHWQKSGQSGEEEKVLRLKHLGTCQ